MMCLAFIQGTPGRPFSVYWIRLSHMDAASIELQDDDPVHAEIWKCLEQGTDGNAADLQRRKAMQCMLYDSGDSMSVTVCFTSIATIEYCRRLDDCMNASSSEQLSKLDVIPAFGILWF